MLVVVVVVVVVVEGGGGGGGGGGGWWWWWQLSQGLAWAGVARPPWFPTRGWEGAEGGGPLRPMALKAFMPLRLYGP